MGILDFLSGGIGGKLAEGAIDIAKGFFPEKLSEEDEKRLAMQLQALTHNHVKEMQLLANEQQAEFNGRLKELEGTASDLKTIPFIGPIIIFLRGVQRPAWGFSTLVIDYHWFSGDWKIDAGQESALYLINLLVLGFLFGERAIKNLEPLITKILEKRL